MKYWRLCSLLILLIGCSPSPEISLPTRVPVTRTPPIFVTSTHTSTPQPLPTTTSSPPPTGTPTETPSPWAYVFPVQPPDMADFSDDANSHGFPATDIFAPEGTRFVAVMSGVVDFVSYEDLWDPANDDLSLRGGLCVAIIGDDGVRYYGSHLSAIESGIRPGLRVEAGQTLGHVGRTGNARFTESHVHFGISSPTYPEDWFLRRGEVNPFPYLMAWLEGRNVTPALPAP